MLSLTSGIPSLTNVLQNSRNFPAKDVFIHQFSKLLNGVSTRKVDALVQSMGMTGISRSQVSSICRGIE